MAAVLKDNKDIPNSASHAVDTPTILDITHKIPSQAQTTGGNMLQKSAIVYYQITA